MKKTIKKRAFVMAIAMLMFTTIALTSSTFAWFTMGDAADVEAMNLTVSSIEGIQISANASTWTSSLTIDEIFDNNPEESSRFDAYAGNTNIYPDTLTPVSSAFATADSSTGFANFFKSGISAASSTADVAAVTQNKEDPAGFIAFDLFFKVDNDDPNATEKIYFGTSTFDDDNEDGTSQNALSALRVAFTPLGTVDSSSATAVDDAIALNAFTASETVSYEVDSLTRSEGSEGTGAIATKYLNTAGNDYTVSKGVLDTGVNINGSAYTDQDVDTDKYFELPVGITKVRVYIWMEGQDVDCLNSVAGSDLVADLNFTIA